MNYEERAGHVRGRGARETNTVNKKQSTRTSEIAPRVNVDRRAARVDLAVHLAVERDRHPPRRVHVQAEAALRRGVAHLVHAEVVAMWPHVPAASVRAVPAPLTAPRSTSVWCTCARSYVVSTSAFSRTSMKQLDFTPVRASECACTGLSAPGDQHSRSTSKPDPDSSGTRVYSPATQLARPRSSRARRAWLAPASGRRRVVRAHLARERERGGECRRERLPLGRVAAERALARHGFVVRLLHRRNCTVLHSDGGSSQLLLCLVVSRPLQLVECASIGLSVRLRVNCHERKDRPVDRPS